MLFIFELNIVDMILEIVSQNVIVEMMLLLFIFFGYGVCLFIIRKTILNSKKKQ